MSLLRRNDILEYFRNGGTRYEFYNISGMNLKPSILRFFNVSLNEIKNIEFENLLSDFSIYNTYLFIDDNFDVLDFDDYIKIAELLDKINFNAIDNSSKIYYISIYLDFIGINYTGILNSFKENNCTSLYNEYLNKYKFYLNNLNDEHFLAVFEDYDKNIDSYMRRSNYRTIEESFFGHKFEDDYWKVKDYKDLKIDAEVFLINQKIL